MIENTTRVGQGGSPSHGAAAIFQQKQERQAATLQREKSLRHDGTTNKRIGAVLGLAALVGIGSAMKDGINIGFKRIAGFSNTLSNVFALPVSLLFPYILAKEEYELLRNGKKGEEENAALVFYPLLSLAFTPRTWGEPLAQGTRSKTHMIATLANLPHMIFALLSYTGGRAMSLVKIIEMYFKKDSAQKLYKTEQERKSFHRLGNFGSNHCSIIPLAGMFATGVHILKDIFTLNFGSAWEKFKHEPVAATLGTLFNWWAFIPDYISKVLDTTIRTAETVDQFKYALGHESLVTKKLEALRDKWHKTSQDSSNPIGRFLKSGRDLAKMEALIIPPIGMVSIVTTMFDKYLRGKMFNEEAQEIGGTIAALDKVFSLGSFLMHLYYTTVYTFTTRLPQTITTTAFYLTNLINKARGIDLNKEGYENHPRYIDPNSIRDMIFNRPFIRKISNWAARKINGMEKVLHPDKPELIQEDENGNLTRNCKLIGNYESAIAKNECFIPISEQIYHEEVITKEFYDEGLGRKKLLGEKCSAKKWGKILTRYFENGEFLRMSEERFDKYLAESELFTEEQISVYKSVKYPAVKEALIEQIRKEIENCKQGDLIPATRKLVNKSETFLGLLKNPKELLEVLKLRTFHRFFSILPLSILNFVQVFDLGKKGEPQWLRNHVATYTGINIGDNEIACNLELTPVAAHAWGSVGKALAFFHNLFQGRLQFIPDEK